MQDAPLDTEDALETLFSRNLSRSGAAILSTTSDSILASRLNMVDTATPDPSRTDERYTESHLLHTPAQKEQLSSLTIVDFVQRNFIPEFVVRKRSAGRDHFKALLKHVLSPDEVARIFALPSGTKGKLTSIPGWPYLGAMRLSEVNTDAVQDLICAALEHGYSIQTVTHLRNVVRSIFAHAIRTGCHFDQNPAVSVRLPHIDRSSSRSLTLPQLKQVLAAMNYPEREFFLITIFTDLNVAEVCGLQWRYLNLLTSSRIVDQEVIPPGTLAIRRQNYRGLLSTVLRSRRRFVPVPRILAAHLFDLKQRSRYTGPQDYVLASRNGNPLHPANIAARRLKSIGHALDIPSLTWAAFHTTRKSLKAEFGDTLYDEILPTIVDMPPAIQTQSMRGRLWA